MKLSPAKSIRGSVTVPGDKSISHRSVMLGSIARGTTEIHGFLEGADCLSTISCFRHMGVDIENKNGVVTVHGKGLRGLSAPSAPLDCGNSGTTTRLISGILAAQDFSAVLTGDASIQKRPMGRIITPLSMMGADIKSIHGNGCAPLQITGKPLSGICYDSPVASAQVKSAILLAGLYAEGETRVTEPQISRNHTELMLKFFGADIRTEGSTATVRQTPELYGNRITVPGFLPPAVSFPPAESPLPTSGVLIKTAGTTPPRPAFFPVCRAWGAARPLITRAPGGPGPPAALLVRSSSLHGTVIQGSVIPAMIDELPTVALMACFAQGRTVIKDAAELKVKESNRIALVAENLRAMGADVTETDDGMIIDGGRPLHGASISAHKDHRLAMTFAIAALAAEGSTELQDADCVSISYPDFYTDLKRLVRS